MAVFCDELEAVEVGAHLGDVVDHRGDAKDGGVTAVVLTLACYHIDIWHVCFETGSLDTAGDFIRHGSQIRPQLSAASPTNRLQPKVIITIVIIKLKLWPAAGCEAKVVAELSSCP